MARKRRNQNKGLPSRWRYRFGFYYYRVPKGLEHLWDNKTEYKLGSTLTEAYKTWAEKLPNEIEAKIFNELFDRYSLEVLPTKVPKSQESNRTSLSRLRQAFGQMYLTAVKPSHAYKYLDVCSKSHGAASANRDYEVLSHSLTMAVQWGVIDFNPLIGQVKKLKTQRRERYVEDWEIAEVLKVAKPFEKAYIALKLLTGLRRSDLLTLQESDIQPDGLYVCPRKTLNSSGVSIVFELVPELEDALQLARDARPAPSQYFFCNRNGQSYYDVSTGHANGFDSVWRRLMEKALKQTQLTDRFQEKDLRKKVASDMSLELASQLLGHASTDTTKRHYQLKPTRVTPNIKK
jgi:integrase